MNSAKETLGFQTEVKQLLKLMIHSLYSNKEIFLRELISNASDAADKLRFEALSDPNLLKEGSELKVRLSVDTAARTLTISDNGIGMSRDEVIDNIGTIAKSGTKTFFEQLSGDAKQDAQLIGQFGVGFYSAFIVADQVTLKTRRANAPASEGVCWQSSGDGEYTVETLDRLTRGTDIVLHFREGEEDFLDEWRLSSIIQKYSDHISLPIELDKQKRDDKGELTGEVEAQVVNQASALWTRPRTEIEEAQYQAFYQHIAHDWQPALAWTHSRVEGRQEYIALLYIPSQAPFDLWDRDRKQGLKLYVRRVFIMDDAERFLPQYLRFIKGVVDSQDLPLNVSRELLQHSKDIDAIRAGCVKKVLGLLEDLANSEDEAQREKYDKFWQAFGQVFKEGLGEDAAHKQRIAKLCRFASTHAAQAKPQVSLDAYVSRMKAGQDKIYYVTADSFAAAQNSPHLEFFRKKGVEVLLLSDRVDEWVVGHLQDYDNHPLKSISKGALDLDNLADESDKAEQQQAESELKDTIARVKTVLGEQVKDVRITHRLTGSPACLVADEHDMGSHLIRLLKTAGQPVTVSKPILELNPTHPLVQKLADVPEERFEPLATVLFEQALLAEGGQLTDPAAFVRRMNQLLLASV